MKLPRWVVILIYLTCWPAAVFAHPTLTASNGDSLILYEAKCEDQAILAYIVANGAGKYLDQFKQATLLFGGVTLKSCWLEHEGLVYSIDETGDKLQPIPRSAFKDSSI